MQMCSLHINGQVIPTQETFDVINPATGEVFAKCSLATEEHVDMAVKAARNAFPAWSARSDAERSALCLELAQTLEENMPEMMELVTQENGKPLVGLNNVGSGMEVGGSIAWIQATANTALPVDVIQEDAQYSIEVHRKPLGVVGSITPWNWPLLIAIWHVIPALKTGNTVVLKPSEYTPVATARFVELANHILPPGVLNVVTGFGQVGAAMSAHPDINKIVFTGSTHTGRKIMAASAGNLKRLTLELGGNDAGIVLPDIDVKALAPRIFAACFHNNGQTCAALKRLYVHENIFDELAKELIRIAAEVKVGNGLEEGVDLGPVQNEKQFRIVEALASAARAEGGDFIIGGNRKSGPGYFYEPTIVTGLTNGSRLVDEEPFGPIVPMIKVSNIDEAISLANDSDYGLGGSVWSADLAQATQVAARMECGTTWINEHGEIRPDVPFGGVKQSGFGVEFGVYGLEEFTHIQTLKVLKQ